MKIDYREGLLFTNVEICYKGRKKIINNIVLFQQVFFVCCDEKAVDAAGKVYFLFFSQ